MNRPKQHGPTGRENYDVRLARIEEKLEHCATKADVHESIGAANARLNVIEATVASIQEHGATKADLMELETRLIKWMIATAVAVTGVIIAAVGVLLMVLPRLMPPR